MKFRKKPVVIEAEQYNGADGIEARQYRSKILPKLPDGVRWRHESRDDVYIPVITTLEGEMIVKPGDWIITGVKGEKYPCKPDIFEATYEKVED